MAFSFSRVAFVPIFALALVLFGAGCASSSLKTATPFETGSNISILKKKAFNPQVLSSADDALAFYQAVRASFKQDTPDTYLSLVRYQNPRDEALLELPEKWQDDFWRESRMSYPFPDISKNEPVGFQVLGDKAAYHYLVPIDPEEPVYGAPRQEIRSLLFVNENGSWKMLEDDVVDSVPVEATPEKRQQVFAEYQDNFFTRNVSEWEVYRYTNGTHLTRLKLDNTDLLAGADGKALTLPYRPTYRLTVSEKGIEQIEGQININAAGFGYGLGFNAPITPTPEQTFTKIVQFPEHVRGKEVTIKVRLTGENSYDVREERVVKFRFAE